MEKASNVETESVPDLLALSESAQTVGGEINASGHRQELQRNFKLLALCGVAITTGNSWLALGGTIVRLPSSMHAKFVSADEVQVVGLYNGGSPGLIYELWVFGHGAKAKRIADAGIASWYSSFTASLQLPLPSWRLPYRRLAAVRPPPAPNCSVGV